MKHTGTIFTLLDQIRERPKMYLLHESLEELEVLMWGYDAALRMNGIVESVPAINRHFLDWLSYRTGWSCAVGLTQLIVEHYSASESPLSRFFLWVDEYRTLKPTALYRVVLQPKHQSTGKRVIYWHGGRMESPSHVEIMQYQPTPLHFLTLHYPDRIEQQDVLQVGSGDYATSPDDAKRFMADEFQVALNEWESLL